MSIPLDKFEFHNLVLNEGGIQVRKAFREHITPTSLVGAGNKFVYAFSERATNTNEIFHYFVVRNTATGAGTVYVTTEEFKVICIHQLGNIPPEAKLYHSVRYQQLILNSPHIANAAYGLVGGGLKRAEKVDSVNLNTTTIQIPLGIICRFGDRNAVAAGNVVFFSDAGTEPRTFTGVNVLSVDALIYDMFEGPGGALTICAANGVHILPTDALGVGQKVVGFLHKISDFGVAGFRNATFSKNAVVALDKNGISLVGDNLEHIDLTSYKYKRYFTSYVGPGSSGDYRAGTVWKTNDGVVASINKKLCFLNLETGKPSWCYNSADLTIVGVCKARDGSDLFVTPDRMFQMFGNVEFDNTEIKGIACGKLDTEPETNPVVRFVTTTADNVGLRQFLYIDGTPKTKVTPAPSRADNVIETDLWSTTGSYAGTEMRSRRHEVSARTDDICFEVGAAGCQTNVGTITIETGGKGKTRP